MAVNRIPNHNPDDMHLNLMACDFGCANQEQAVQAIIECINQNDYASDPTYLVQCLTESFHPEVVQQVKILFDL